MPPSVGWLKEESVRPWTKGVKPLGGYACVLRIALLPVAR